LFVGASIESMKPIKNNPIALPSKKGYGSHLSDPCLYCDDENLYCFYRDTINYGEKIENRICYKIINSDGTFSEEKLLISSFTDGLLSPAIIKTENVLYLFYVSYIQNKLVLKKAIITNSMKITSETEVSVVNEHPNWDIWHIDVKYIAGKIEFLLLQRSKDAKNFKLQKAYFDINNQSVILQDDITLPDELISVTNHVYKSCLIPGKENKILLNIRDDNAVYITKIL